MIIIKLQITHFFKLSITIKETKTQKNDVFYVMILLYKNVV